jgi:hypothetical protein
MANWPWPEDTTLDRLKRIIYSYRDALRLTDEQTCNLVDARMAEFGQGWVCSDLVVDVNELKTCKEIADQFGFSPWDIQNWHQRHPDQIPLRGKKGNRNLFRVGDVLAYQVQQRKNRTSN